MKHNNLMNDKKGFGLLMGVLSFAMILIIIYIVLLIPIPAFTKIRAIINFYSIILLWFMVQALLVSIYVYIVMKAYPNVKKGIAKMKSWTFDIKQHILLHH